MKPSRLTTSTLITAATISILAGCASTTPATDAAPQTQPAPDKLPPVAVPAPPVKPGDDLAAVRDPNNPLSKRSVFFDFDDFTVKQQYYGLIDLHGKFLAGKPKAKVMVQGHADERGSHEYNLALGQKRAEAVRRALIAKGTADAQLEAVSFGEEKPRAQGHDEAAWSQNRRVDLAYPGEY